MAEIFGQFSAAALSNRSGISKVFAAPTGVMVPSGTLEAPRVNGNADGVGQFDRANSV